MKLAILILNFNKPGTTLRCAKSVDLALIDSGFTTVRKLVIDNGSKQSLVGQLDELLDTENPWELVSADKNLGFAGGMNYGLAKIDANRFDYFLFLNNDVEIEKGALQKAAQYLCNFPEKLLIGFHIKDLKTRKTVTIGGYRYYPCVGMARPNKRQSPTTSLNPISYVDGCAFFAKCDFIRDQGGLPSSNFMYFEELYLARALNSDSELGYCGDAVVHHEGGATVKEHFDNFEHHGLAMEACLRFTKTTDPKLVPSVLIMRLAWLVIVSVRHISFRPIAAGVSALAALISGPESPEK